MPRPPGRPPRLSREIVVSAAVEAVRADGFAGLTMRALADRLGATPMSLYRHVGDRDELARLVIEDLFARMTFPDESLSAGEWLRTLASQIRAIGRAHRGAMDVLLDEGPVVRSTLVILDRMVQKLHDDGLGWKTAGVVHNTFMSWLAATIRREERWTARAAAGVSLRFLEVAAGMPKAEYPGLAHVLGDMPGNDVDLEFERSLTFMIDAIEAKIAARKKR